jgi:hypothetical protein
MNVCRKFQLVACAVIASGVIALGLLSPKVALAQTDCLGEAYVCIGEGPCPSLQDQIESCEAFYRGCTVVDTECYINDGDPCDGYEIQCTLEPR